MNKEERKLFQNVVKDYDKNKLGHGVEVMTGGKKHRLDSEEQRPGGSTGRS